MKYTNTIEGWMSDMELDWLHQQAVQFKTVVEIGSYRGRSTTALCNGCQGIVFSVDLFREEDWLVFQKNMRGRTNLSVMRGRSVEAASHFADNSVDMVFIDGDHSYEGCKADIEAWLPKCRHLICGHDYTDDGKGHWPGVVQAVGEQFASIQKIETIWAVALKKNL